ncbi:hypothetical protein [Mesorhizobium sp.]|uniref:hypothetical protein n=1 Tax=Mesorhizobium sp. TaxID=1871066 RepID=UPI000FEA3DD0|nr:hypothetical protein [Mesorhizobium sp.]RWF33752.1 MAG: hypothetical protein EOS45_02140 [Mesorhizobium sp.]
MIDYLISTVFGSIAMLCLIALWATGSKRSACFMGAAWLALIAFVIATKPASAKEIAYVIDVQNVTTSLSPQ